MKKKNSVNPLGQRLVILTCLFLIASGVFGVGTVWLRHEIATAGTATRVLENRLAELERHEARVTSEIAQSLHPAFLKMQNERFSLGLRPAREEQVIRVSAEEQERFVRMRAETLARASDGYELTFSGREQTR